MALAATHFQTGADAAEREALLWIEKLPQPPTVRAPVAFVRAIVEQFVPVNDKAIWKKDPAKPKQKPPPPLQSTPGIMRDRQPRTFARAFLDSDTVYLAWPEANPSEAMRVALRALCAKVTRVGHSSSLVQMWLATADEVGEPNWVPDDVRPELYLRVAGPGTLEDLERRYNRDAIESYASLRVTEADDADRKAQMAARKRLREEFSNGPPLQLRPDLPLYQGYAHPTPAADELAAPGTVFSPYVTVQTIEPDTSPYRNLDLPCILQVAQRWREAILSQADSLSDRVRHLLSGHDRNGLPLEEPHLAFVPLAFVGHPHADGRLLGMGFALPERLSPEERRQTLGAVGRVRRLLLGRLGVWQVTSLTASRPAWNLRPEAWTGHPEGATHWSTVTPIAYDRHPKTDNRAEYQCEVASMIADACVRIALPEPQEVIVTPVSAHLGTPPAHSFPRLRRKDGGERRHTHAILVFDRPVRGPILLGAGRYRGYGLCRPMREPEAGPA